MSANMQQDWKHWRLRREDTGLAWLELDKADSSTNVLSSEVMSEFARVLDALDAAPPKALVIASAKPAARTSRPDNARSSASKRRTSSSGNSVARHRRSPSRLASTTSGHAATCSSGSAVAHHTRLRAIRARSWSTLPSLMILPRAITQTRSASASASSR